MNILIYEHKNFGIEDVKDALTALGHDYKCISDERIRQRQCPEFNTSFENEMEKGNYDCVFTFNYCIAISNNCNRFNLPYIAFVYDSPLISLYSYTITNPCNYIFLFDKQMYDELRNGGISTVYYCPLAVNTKRLETMLSAATSNHKELYSSPVSFVGSMYNEKHNLFERLKDLSPFTKGYLDAIMDAQLKVYGYYFIEELLTPNIIADLQKSVPVTPNKDGIETPSYVYAYYFIARKLAQIERQTILSDISGHFPTKLYTPAPTPNLPEIENMGPVDYYNHMPYIFNYSDINLNISLRSIRSGIPLRCMDIMGAGGFLLSNYQADFYDFFIPGEDMVLFDSCEDAVNKCDYYLKHEKERQQIAANGHGKVKEYHTYEKRLKEMLTIVFS
ncbi:MAG: DUF3880 domain-containing protein [Eubacteriales bacterium]|nr:DUF3880 domain-containing protein [Eubacteriales bacterium]